MKKLLTFCGVAALLVSANAVSAKEVGPVTPLVDIPSFTLAVPGFATYAATIVATGTPSGSVKCPVWIQYVAKVTLTPATPGKVIASPVEDSWTPARSLAGSYDVSGDGNPSQSLLSAPLMSTFTVTFKASTASEGLPVTFFLKVPGQTAKQELRVVSHVQCLGSRTLHYH